MNNSIFGIFIALISTISWALCAIILKKLGERIDAIGMTAIKSVISVILLFAIIISSGINLSIDIHYITLIALSGIFGIAIGDSLFFASLSRLSPLVLSIILFVGPDLFSGIFGLIFLKEIPSVMAWIGIFAILTGLSCLLFPIKHNPGEGKTQITGIILALLSLICTAYSMVIIKPVLINVPVITATMYRMIFSSILLILFGVFSRKIHNWISALNDKKYNMQLIGTFSFATIGGFWLSLCAIKYCKLIIASSVMSLEPLFILIFMILFNKYTPKKKEVWGIFIILLGIILLCME